MPALIFPAPGPVGNNNAQWTDTANSFTGFSVTKSFISSKTSLRVKNPLPKNNEVNNRRVGNVNRRDVIRNPLPKNNEVNNFKVIGKVSRGFDARNPLSKTRERKALGVNKVVQNIVTKNPLPKTLDAKIFDVNFTSPFKAASSTNQVFTLPTRLGKATSNIIVRNTFPKTVDEKIFDVNLIRRNPIAVNSLPKTLDAKIFDVNYITVPLLKVNYTQVFFLKPNLGKINKGVSLKNALPKSNDLKAFRIGIIRSFRQGADITEEVLRPPFLKSFDQRVFDVEKIRNLDVLKATFSKQLNSKVFDPNITFTRFKDTTFQGFSIIRKVALVNDGFSLKNALPKGFDQNGLKFGKVIKPIFVTNVLPKTVDAKVFDVNYIRSPLLNKNYTQVFFIRPSLGRINKGLEIVNALPKTVNLNNFRVSVIRSFRQGANITEEVLRPPYSKTFEQRVFDVEKIKSSINIKNAFSKSLDSKAFDVNYIVSRFIVKSSTTQVFSLNTKVGKMRRVLNVQNALPKDLDRKAFRVVGKTFKGIVVTNPLPKTLDSKVFDPNIIQPFKANNLKNQVFTLNTKVSVLKKDFTTLKAPLPKDLDRKAFRIVGKTFKGLVVINGLPKTLDAKIFDVSTLTKNTIKVRPVYTKTLDSKVFDPGVTFTRFKDTTFQGFSIIRKVALVNDGFSLKSSFSKGFSSTLQKPGTLTKQLLSLRDIPGAHLRRRVNLLRPSIRVVGSHQTNYKVANVTSNVAQANVRTTLAPSNARENFYYFTLAPGKRQDTARAIWSKDPLELFSNVIITVGASSNVTASFPNTSFASFRTQVFSLITKIAIISSNVGQNTVVTTTAPTNARENFYYFTLAPGKRQDTARDIFSKPATGLVINSQKIGIITSNVRQNTVSTIVAPTNARENFYYFTLAPGKRQDTAREVFSKPATGLVINSQKIGIISSNVRQNTVITTTAPTNARENLYYFTIAPGKRQDTARAIWSKDPLQTALRKEIEQKVAGSVNRGKLVVRTPLRSRVYFEAQNVTSNISQSNVSTTKYPTSPREYLYYAVRAPGLYGNKDYFKNVPGGLNENFFDVNTTKAPGLVVRSAFPKPLDSKVFDSTIIKVIPLAANSSQTHVFSLNTKVMQLNKAYISLRNPLTKTYEAKVLNTDKLTVSIVVKGSMPKVLDSKVFDANFVGPFKTKLSTNQVFTLSTIVDNFKTTSVLRNTYSKTFDQKQFRGNYVSKEVKVASVFSKQLDSKVFDPGLTFTRFKDTTFQGFTLKTKIDQLPKQFVVLKNTFPKLLEEKQFRVNKLRKDAIVVNALPKSLEAKVFQTASKGFNYAQNIVKPVYAKVLESKVFGANFVSPPKLRKEYNQVFSLPIKVAKLDTIAAKRISVFDVTFRTKVEPLQFWN